MEPLASVADAARYGYETSEVYLRRASARVRSVAVVPEDLSDSTREALTELVCAIACRLENADTLPEAQNMGLGVSSETAGPFAYSYGFDAYKATSGLSAGELQRLKAILPRAARVYLMGGYRAEG